MKICTFYLSGYESLSGYSLTWETSGSFECVGTPFQGNDEKEYQKFILEPGQYLFCIKREVEESLAQLFQIPIEKDQFEVFCVKAEEWAGTSVYNRLMGYKNGSGGPYDYSQNFTGDWLKDYLIKSWDIDSLESYPISLEDAIKYK
ncbi:MAG: hypothetical protein AAB870_03050 [Patescibacteria group bacterium]